MMNTKVASILRQLYLEQGNAVFKDKKRIESYIADLLYAYPADSAKIRTAVDEGIIIKIINEIDSASNLSRAHIYVDQLIQMRGMSENAAAETVEVLVYAVFGKQISLKKSPAAPEKKPDPVFSTPPDFGNIKKNKLRKKKSIGAGLGKAAGFLVAAGVLLAIFGGRDSLDFDKKEAAVQETVIYVTDTNLTSLSAWKKNERVKVDKEEVTANTGTVYNGGITADYPYSDITYALNGNYDKLSAVWAIDQNKRNTDYFSSFEIFADGKSVYTSPRITGGDIPIDVEVPLNYCNSIMIQFKECNGSAFLGDIVLSSSQTDRVYQNEPIGSVLTSQWLAQMEYFKKESAQVASGSIINICGGPQMGSPLSSDWDRYSNADDTEFRENGGFIEYYLNGEYKELSGTIGIFDNGMNLEGSMVISVLADEEELYSSQILTRESVPEVFRINIEGCEKLTIKFEPIENTRNWGYDAYGYKIGDLKLYK